MALLESMVTYCAFPSQDVVKLLWQLFEPQDFGVLSRMVARVVRARTGGT